MDQHKIGLHHGHCKEAAFNRDFTETSISKPCSSYKMETLLVIDDNNK